MVAYLRCELTARDLDSRLLIAQHLLAAGITTVVGQQWSIEANTENAPAGVVVFTTANKYQALGMRRARTAGHRVVVMDEEALALRDERTLLEIVDSEVEAHCDVFAFQDEAKMSLIKKKLPGLNGRVTGSARVELLRRARDIYRDKIKAIITLT